MRPWSFIELLVCGMLIASCGPSKKVNGAHDGAPSQEQPQRGGTGERREAPVHGVPDQQELDSLKQEKQKQRLPQE